MKKLTETFNKVSVHKGEKFMIELPSNATTGYSWELAVVSGKATLVKEDYISDHPPEKYGNRHEEDFIVGGGGKDRYIFEAQETGALTINANYRRSWEKKAPEKSQTFHITVIQ